MQSSVLMKILGFAIFLMIGGLLWSAFMKPSKVEAVDNGVIAANEDNESVRNFRRAVQQIRAGKPHGKRKDVSYLFDGLLPKSSKLLDHIEYFRNFGAIESLRHPGPRYVYAFTFDGARLRKYGGSQFLPEDQLVFVYITNEASTNALITKKNVAFLYGNIK